MYKFSLILLFFFANATLSQAGNGVETGTVTGTIVDAETKKPVANVSLSAILQNRGYRKTIVTDAQGNFIMSHVPVGEHIHFIDKRGYKLYRKEGIQVKHGTPLKMYIELLPDEPAGLHSNMIPITLHSI
jgi:hypothetical protein